MIYYYKIPSDTLINSRKDETELARRVLAAALKKEYGIDKLPDIEKNDKGKPYFTNLPHIQFNYSHCRYEILCGIAKGPIGVDVESKRTFRPGFARHVCHPNELELLDGASDMDETLLSLWVAKEAYLKYLGEGIRHSLREIDMSGVINGKNQTDKNIYIRLWKEKEVHRCVCCLEKEQLRLIEFENI
ncbi:MAG: 4'-phosphopantetheinyl transferase superfamily protein [Eubacteriales bacterium]|nr:4'-phosphopantetheinyl transferase superfamily protein [Eubacteriales bacterium]